MHSGAPQKIATSTNKGGIITAVNSNDKKIMSERRGESQNTEEDETSLLSDDLMALNSLLKVEYGLNMNLYQFDIKHEFNDEKKINPKLLQAFINFSNKLDKVFAGFNVLSLL